MSTSLCPFRNAEKEENREQWVVDLETKSRSYDPQEYDEKKKRRCIYKWPNDLVAASSLSRHRTPRTISLGPYHHGKPHLQHMEHHKERALLRILHRSSIPVTTFIQSLQDVEQELRDSYDNLDPKLSPHLFLRMMLFDGCFLLEMLRSETNSPDPFFVGSDRVCTGIVLDMMKLENQIPLLVLEKLLAVENGNEMNHREYLPFLVNKILGSDVVIHRPYLHILDILWEHYIPQKGPPEEEETPISIWSHFRPWLLPAGKGLKRLLMAMVIAIPILLFWLLHGRIPKHGHFRNATKLHEAGIKFKRGKLGSGLTITFDEKNGVLTLPCFELTEATPIFFMNMIAFERMHPPLFGNAKLTDYMALMDELIDTAEDVRVLCSQGILSNYLASDEDAAKLFNAFSVGLHYLGGDGVTLRLQSQRYTASDWNLTIGHLNHYHFQSPCLKTQPHLHFI